MRFSIVDNKHIVTLSRRNLLGLLAKLDDPESKRTLIKQEVGGLTLILHAEEDDEHYSSRPEGGPGPMIDRTELQVENTQLKADLARLLRAGECSTVDELVNELETSY